MTVRGATIVASSAGLPAGQLTRTDSGLRTMALTTRSRARSTPMNGIPAKALNSSEGAVISVLTSGSLTELNAKVSAVSPI